MEKSAAVESALGLAQVIMTQVLHHLTPDTHATALSEIARVLRPGGTCWISTQTPHQHMEGFWWAPIIPQVRSRQSPPA